MANAAVKGLTATGDGTVTLSSNTYNFNFSGQSGGKGGFTIFNVADRKNLVTAGKTNCIAQIEPNTVAIIGTASNKNTDPAFNKHPLVLVVAQDSPDAIYIAGTTGTDCSKISADTTLTTGINGSITITSGT